MTAIFIKTFLEFSIIVLLLYGFVHEKDVIRFEQRLWKVVRRYAHRAKIGICRALYNLICKFEKKQAK